MGGAVLSGGLFDHDGGDATELYQALRAPGDEMQVAVREALDVMWAAYQPYADRNFAAKFVRETEERFWELRLGSSLLAANKTLRPRAAAKQDEGPDIGIDEDGRTLRIEATAPGPGDGEDAVPEPVKGKANWAPRREVELRITSALYSKWRQLEDHRAKGLIGPQDACAVAVSTARFWRQSGFLGLPPAVTALYPFGNEYAKFNVETLELVEEGIAYSSEIERTQASAIPRDGFLSEQFKNLSGLIWSRATIGSANWALRDLMFVHNRAGTVRFPERWFDWSSEWVVHQDEIGGIEAENLSDPARENGV